MDELTLLSNATLETLGGQVRTPRYDRNHLQPGIVHIGLGNFHRAHQAWYLHRLFDQGMNHDWAIIGAGVRPGDAIQREKLRTQDCLTTLIELDPSGKSAEIIGSIIDYVPIEEGNHALIEKMADPSIRIVSLTVTEGGYFIDPSSGGFDANHPDVLHDAQHPDRPRTAFGAMIGALDMRRKNNHGPFTGLSCDNLQGNGRILHRAIVSLARLSDPELADWIDDNCSFPNSMVDCIVPSTGPKELALAREFGIDDLTPVTHENYRQWVIEDDFCAGRPDLDKAGATFSDRVHDFESMKLRILNGGHQIVAIPGELLGIGTVAETMANPAIRIFLRKVVTEEIAPYVSLLPGVTPAEYLDLVDSRFSNPEIADSTRRVAFDGSSRQPGFIGPSIRDGLKSGNPVEGLALVSALWAHYCAGRREDGSVIEPNDPNWHELQETAKIAQNEPVEWLKMRQYYGNLANDPRFSKPFEKWFQAISTKGVVGAIEQFAAGWKNWRVLVDAG